MPVFGIKGAQKKSAKLRLARVLECDSCGYRATFVGGSPAAPDLTACEEAGKVGWSYDCGFFSMLCGHTVYCPECTAKAKAKES